MTWRTNQQCRPQSSPQKTPLVVAVGDQMFYTLSQHHQKPLTLTFDPLLHKPQKRSAALQVILHHLQGPCMTPHPTDLTRSCFLVQSDLDGAGAQPGLRERPRTSLLPLSSANARNRSQLGSSVAAQQQPDGSSLRRACWGNYCLRSKWVSDQTKTKADHLGSMRGESKQ